LDDDLFDVYHVKERSTKGESKRGEASLIYPSPFPLIRGRGTKGDRVTRDKNLNRVKLINIKNIYRS